MFVDYRLLQLHRAIHNAPDLMLFFVSYIATGNETGDPSVVWVILWVFVGPSSPD